MPANEPVLITELKNGVMTILLNRPRVNAFNMEMTESLQTAFKQAQRDAAVRCVLLSGAGSVFSGGQDITEFKRVEGTSYRAHLQHTYNPLILQIRELEKPVIAAINGSVSGAALGIALACDLRVASDDARLVVGFNGIGLAPDSAVSLLLPALIGLGRAAEYTFSNAPISAARAFEMGLVNRVVPAGELMAQASALAAALAQGPVGAFGLTKRTFNRAMLSNLEQVLDYEAHIQDIAGRGSEHAEGVQAFLEKRPPRFNNQP